ncbi:restriction endonuclease subunit S [Vibrio cortegadensis]|uniref:restriction endonuclease subunit S n=1 Tax=Vibrio cortegadensis TaxID=1328770 RepID=UPI00352E5566
MSELPKGWALSTIGQACLIENGLRKPISLKERAACQGDFPYYGATGVIDHLNSYTHEGEYVLIGEDGANLLSKSKPLAFIANGQYWVNNHAHTLKCLAGSPNEYLERYFNSLSLEPWVTGSAQPKLTKKNLESIPFPLAPLPEQKRIVEKLDEVLAQVDVIKARLDGIPILLKRFRQSVLSSAVSGKLTEEWRNGNSANTTETLHSLEEHKVCLIAQKEIKKDLDFEVSKNLFETPSDWSFVRLKSLAWKITDGEHKTPKREESGRFLLSARNVRDGYLSLDKVDYVGEEEYQKLRKRCDPNKGDVLVSCSGSVGRISLVDADDQYVMVRSAALVKVLDDYIVNRFLMYVLQSPYLQKRIEESSKSTAQSNLFLGPIKELEIPLPVLSEQKEIVRLVDQYFAFANHIEAQVKKAQAKVDNLTQSILTKAFRGELVPQNPNDESADKLLERIAKAREEAEALAKAAKKVQAAKKRAAKA